MNVSRSFIRILSGLVIGGVAYVLAPTGCIAQTAHPPIVERVVVDGVEKWVSYDPTKDSGVVMTEFRRRAEETKHMAAKEPVSPYGEAQVAPQAALPITWSMQRLLERSDSMARLELGWTLGFNREQRQRFAFQINELFHRIAHVDTVHAQGMRIPFRVAPEGFQSLTPEEATYRAFSPLSIIPWQIDTTEHRPNDLTASLSVTYRLWSPMCPEWTGYFTVIQNGHSTRFEQYNLTGGLPPILRLDSNTGRPVVPPLASQPAGETARRMSFAGLYDRVATDSSLSAPMVTRMQLLARIQSAGPHWVGDVDTTGFYTKAVRFSSESASSALLPVRQPLTNEIQPSRGSLSIWLGYDWVRTRWVWHIKHELPSKGNSYSFVQYQEYDAFTGIECSETP